MAYTVVRKITAAATTQTGSATLDASPTQGDLLVAVVGSNGSSTDAVTTPSGWTLAAHGGGAYLVINMFYKVAGASESATFSVTYTGTSTTYSTAIVVYEFSTFTATPLDQVANGSNLAAASTSWSTSTTPTTTQADDLCIAAWTSAGAQTDTSYSNSFVKQDSVDESVGGTNTTTAFLETVATGAQTCTMTRTASAANGQGCIATFKVGVLPFLAASPIIHSQAVNRSYTY